MLVEGVLMTPDVREQEEEKQQTLFDPEGLGIPEYLKPSAGRLDRYGTIAPDNTI